MIDCNYKYKNITFNEINELYSIDSVEGLDSASMSDSREAKAGRNGQFDYGQYLRERLVTFKGSILCVTSLGRKQARQALLDNFLNDGIYNWLTWQEDGEVGKQLYCKVFDRKVEDTSAKNYGPYRRPFIVNLLAVDPLIYSQTEITKYIYIPTSVGGRSYPRTYPLSYGTARVGGTASCNNAGNFESLPLVRMYGPLVSPEIKNVTDSNKYIKVNMTVNTGDYLEIDFDKHTVMLNGTASRYLYLDSNDWFSLLPGNNSLTFKDSGGNVLGYCAVIYKSAWI